jgi:hypothetical protein
MKPVHTKNRRARLRAPYKIEIRQHAFHSDLWLWAGVPHANTLGEARDRVAEAKRGGASGHFRAIDYRGHIVDLGE